MSNAGLLGIKEGLITRYIICFFDMSCAAFCRTY